MNVYTIKDKERKVYSPIFLAEDDTVAKRIWAQSIAKSPFWEQCELVWVGEFDPENIESPLIACEPETIETSSDSVEAVWAYNDKSK